MKQTHTDTQSVLERCIYFNYQRQAVKINDNFISFLKNYTDIMNRSIINNLVLSPRDVFNQFIQQTLN